VDLVGGGGAVFVFVDGAGEGCHSV
jgi:hypothetical protein